VSLRNKSYYIFNKPFSKTDYQEEIKRLIFGSYTNLLSIKEKFYSFVKKYPKKFANLINSQNVKGDNIRNAKDVFYCFDVIKGGSEKLKYGLWVPEGVKDSYDLFGSLLSELIYEALAIGWSQKCSFSVMGHYNHDLQYCINCYSSSHLFGCCGLSNKQYCILNKQYTKEEYERLVPKIIEQMMEHPYIDKKGRVYKYGEFFPPELSPFAYNETIAQEYFPLTEEEAVKKGYQWKRPEQRNIIPDIYTKDLPDSIKEVKDEEILGKTIQCSHSKVKEDGTLEQGCNEQCTTAFKIIPQELVFYRKMNLPLPRLCPNCRHYRRIKQRNPLKLYKRRCQCNGESSTNKFYKNTREHFHNKERCPNEFYTTYSPERDEIVYCEECYKREVL
jgi:hypothetical protein